MLRSIFPLVLFILFSTVAASAQDGERKDGRVFWRGEVDAKVQLTISGTTLEQQTVTGRAFPDGNYSFTAPLPSAAVTVSIDKKEGRGNVRVVQQPDSGNGFTAIVEIDDTRGGSAVYLLDISWQ
jgi:hypothetical protein